VAKGRTLWEMWTGKKQVPVLERYFNPMKAKIGSTVTINDIDLKQYDFSVTEIRQYARTIEGKQYLFADYVLHAQPLKGDAVLLRLRVNPTGQTDGAPEHNVLVLRLYDEMAYDKSFHDVVGDTTRKIEVTENNVAQTYTRINDVQGPYKATVSVLRDANQDGKVDEDEVATLQLDYWDYCRETPDEAGTPTVQFLFVEMDNSSGWFQLWRGEEINSQRVVII
jgi:hypothetical protein